MLNFVATLFLKAYFLKITMNAILRFIPLLFNAKAMRGKKRWLSLAAALVMSYQAFSPNGVGADWGIPSYDTFYKEPRDILVTRVEAASDAQQETANEFRSALEQFKSVTGFDGGDLEKKFNTLNSAFEKSEDAATDVRNRVDRVVDATNRLLDEWRDELNEYHDASIKRKAQSQFDDTRAKAEQLIAAMRKAEQKTEPVLGAFRDQVLFLKHNLNTQAVNSLKQESIVIEQDVSALIREMEASIAEAEAFVKELSL